MTSIVRKKSDGTTYSSESFVWDIVDQLTRESRTGYSVSYTYDAFGSQLTSAGSVPLYMGWAGAFGYYRQRDNGLLLVGHRMYDPSTGRFLTRDRAKDGRNWYGYCENNPLKRVDPKGTW